ncbi:hypothetical protein [Allosaccharopolyspora coralli]|nr:hypothetical protein [Allosaccharopolyspora coralli]
MPLDPFADIARRAWIDCPECAHMSGCATCSQQRTCTEHWQYLLSNRGTVVNLQCPTCTHLWSYDTRSMN